MTSRNLCYIFLFNTTNYSLEYYNNSYCISFHTFCKTYRKTWYLCILLQVAVPPTTAHLRPPSTKLMISDTFLGTVFLKNYCRWAGEEQKSAFLWITSNAYSEKLNRLYEVYWSDFSVLLINGFNCYCKKELHDSNKQVHLNICLRCRWTWGRNPMVCYFTKSGSVCHIQ